MFTIWSEQSNLTQFTTVLFILNIILALVIVFLERKDPTATVAWIMILFLVPVVGIVFYFLFSQNIARQKIFKMSPSEEDAITNALHKQLKEIEDDEFEFDAPEAAKWSDMIELNGNYANAYYTQDNKIEILTDGHRMFASLLSDIKKAKNSINFMSFIVKNDKVGQKLIKVLTQKAREGLEVRFLLDAMGSRHIKAELLNDYTEAGGMVAYFFPPRFKYINIKFNYRNHRKIAIIDGDIGYIGGFNIAREYLGLKRKFGYWRDTHIRVMGSSVQDMNARFILDWRFASGEDYPLEGVFYPKSKKAGSTGMQIVSSGPDSRKEEVKRAYMKMITSARKNIFIHTPYFIPDKSILESLKMAAQSGVDVRIMIPCMPDHIFVYWATYAYVGELLNSGVRAFIYDKGFLHSKTVVVDSEVASVGSANFDRRSFSLNFEANAFIYESKEALKLEAIFESDMQKCHELTKNLYSKRSTWIKFKEAIARLLSDIL